MLNERKFYICIVIGSIGLYLWYLMVGLQGLIFVKWLQEHAGAKPLWKNLVPLTTLICSTLGLVFLVVSFVCKKSRAVGVVILSNACLALVSFLLLLEDLSSSIPAQPKTSLLSGIWWGNVGALLTSLVLILLWREWYRLPKGHPKPSSTTP